MRYDTNVLIDHPDEARAARAELDRLELENKLFLSERQKRQLIILALEPPSEFDVPELVDVPTR